LIVPFGVPNPRLVVERVDDAATDLLIRAGWVKRVLFLCDRRELRKQAKNAFNDFLPEPIRIITSRVRSNASEQIFIATYPAMQKVFQSFDPGFFDLIIADESHRSIYNVYGDIFRYFDCHQIGLTATPVDYVTKSTFRLFDCEGLLPTANYDLEQAVKDGYLTPFEVFEHTTQILRSTTSRQNKSTRPSTTKTRTAPFCETSWKMGFVTQRASRPARA
jgi:type I restriction enzyme R subunit